GCGGCGGGGWPLCPGCNAALVALGRAWCDRCGRPSRVPVASCRDCPAHPVSSARAPFLFDGPARRAVHRLKFSGWRDVAAAFADAIVACDELPPVHVVRGVPLARRRRAERGYGRARALAVG